MVYSVYIDDILQAVLDLTPGLGLTDNTLLTACIKLGIPNEYAMFEKGIRDLLDYLDLKLNEGMLQALSQEPNLRVSEKVTFLVKARLLEYTKFKNFREILKAKAKVGYCLTNTSYIFNSLYNITDTIWRAAGDTSTDFNFYTKRATLAAVYSSTVIYFTNDYSHNFIKTWEFLDNRINNVLTFNKIKLRLKSLFC